MISMMAIHHITVNEALRPTDSQKYRILQDLDVAVSSRRTARDAAAFQIEQADPERINDRNTATSISTAIIGASSSIALFWS